MCMLRLLCQGSKFPCPPARSLFILGSIPINWFCIYEGLCSVFLCCFDSYQSAKPSFSPLSARPQGLPSRLFSIYLSYLPPPSPLASLPLSTPSFYFHSLSTPNFHPFLPPLSLFSSFIISYYFFMRSSPNHHQSIKPICAHRQPVQGMPGTHVFVLWDSPIYKLPEDSWWSIPCFSGLRLNLHTKIVGIHEGSFSRNWSS